MPDVHLVRRFVMFPAPVADTSGIPFRARHREPPVEMILDAMAREGWQVLRGLSTSHGAVACLVTGPGGAFALEARTQPGYGRVATVPSAWLRQATAQADAAEGWLGTEVTPLLVLRHASLDRSGSERDGVVVVAASDLAAHLRASGRRTAALVAA